MESSTAVKDDLETGKSFSFTDSSAFKDYSSIVLFSDDNEDDHKNDMMSDTDDNSFIEIALDNPKFNHRRLDQDLDHLRISFSSSFPSNSPEIQPNIVAEFIETSVVRASATPSSSSVRLSASTFRNSSTGTCRGPVLGSESFCLYESSRRRDHLPAFNPLVHPLLFTLEPPPVPTVDENRGDNHKDWEDNHTQLAMINADHKYRKPSNVTTTSGCNHNNKGIMKLLMIKFRATKVRKLLASIFAKPLGNDKCMRKKSLRPCNSKETLEYYDFGDDNMSIINDVPSSCYDHDHQRVGYKCRAVDVNLGAVRGVLVAANMTSSGRRNRKTSSCPSSIKCSPIHQGFAGDVGQFCGGENSIQAAIAYCKSSLGQSSDFRF